MVFYIRSHIHNLEVRLINAQSMQKAAASL